MSLCLRLLIEQKKELYSKERWSNCRWCRGGRGKSAVTPHTTPVPHPFLVRFLSHFDQLAVGISIKVLETCFYWASLFPSVPLCRPETCQPPPIPGEHGSSTTWDAAWSWISQEAQHSWQKVFKFYICPLFANVIRNETPVKSEKKKVSRQAMPE